MEVEVSTGTKVLFAGYLFSYTGDPSHIEIGREAVIVSKPSRNNFKYKFKYFLLIRTLFLEGLRRNERNYKNFPNHHGDAEDKR